MSRSLFSAKTLGITRNGFAGHYRSGFDDFQSRHIDSMPRRKFKWPWIYRFLGYHLMAAFGVIIAFIAWLLWMAA